MGVLENEVPNNGAIIDALVKCESVLK